MSPLEGLEDDEPAVSSHNVRFEKKPRDTPQDLEANIDRTVALSFLILDSIYSLHRRILHQCIRSSEMWGLASVVRSDHPCRRYIRSRTQPLYPTYRKEIP